MTTRLCIVGSFGFGNTGDEAVPLAIGDIAGQIGSAVDVQQLSRFARPAMPNVVGVGEDDAQRRESLRGSRFVYAGGGIVEPREHCVLLRCTKTVCGLGGTTAALAVSVEPGVYSWRLRRRIASALAATKRIFVRDVRSRDILTSLLSKDKDRVHVVGDSVLALAPAATVPATVAATGRYIAVALAPRWSGRHWTEWLALELAILAKAFSAALVFVPCSEAADSDTPIHTFIADSVRRTDPNIECLVLQEVGGPREVMAVIGKAVLTIGMRLHACVMAFAREIPAVGLVYHPKLQAFAETVGIGSCFFPSLPFASALPPWHESPFEDPRYRELSLLSLARTACDSADFSALSDFRSRLRQALSDVLREGTPDLVPLGPGE